MGREPEETFTDRFKRLVTGMTDTRLAVIMGMSPYAVRKLRQGDTQSLKLEQALRLCKALNISPWILVGADNHQDAPPPDVEDRLRLVQGDVAELQEKLADLNERVAPLLERAGATERRRTGTGRRR